MKKYVNHIDRPSKDLVIGQQSINMDVLVSVFHGYKPVEHRLHREDLLKSRNRMSVDPCLRLTSTVCCVHCSLELSVLKHGLFVQAVLDCIRKLHQPEYDATRLFLRAISQYNSAFCDSGLPWDTVIAWLAYVAVFLRGWNLWVSETGQPMKHRLTPQTCHHIELSVHATVNLLGYWHDYNLSSFPPDLSRLVRSCYCLGVYLRFPC